MTTERVYVLVAIDKTALDDGPSTQPPEEQVRFWVGQYVFDDQFAVADVTLEMDGFCNELAVQEMEKRLS